MDTLSIPNLNTVMN